MDDQDKTFDKLRQAPITEMVKKLEELQYPAIVLALGNYIGGVDELQNDMIKFDYRNRLLIECGWTYDEFLRQLEKRTIEKAIIEYNNKNVLAKEFVDRARAYFPNATFIPARIELE